LNSDANMNVNFNVKISVQIEDFDLNEELTCMRQKNAQIGALVSFVGLVRDINQGMTIQSMELEHYPGMTEKSLLDIVQQAQQRWSLDDCTVIHRVGVLHISDQIVLVAVASRHRGDAFAACEFIMDYLKTLAPFWKKEVTENGAHWVDARESDELATQKWASGE
jgi:molybdopterin synthase catalytic subunit